MREMKRKTYLDKLKDLIRELEEGMVNSLEEDQFGYAKQDAYDVYKKVISKLKALVDIV